MGADVFFVLWFLITTLLIQNTNPAFRPRCSGAACRRLLPALAVNAGGGASFTSTRNRPWIKQRLRVRNRDDRVRQQLGGCCRTDCQYLTTFQQPSPLLYVDPEC